MLRLPWYNHPMRNVLLLALAVASLAFAEARPKVRAITAFIRIDAAHLETQVSEAVKFLTGAREEYKAAGFEVETIRVVTQPLADYTKGMKHADALALLRKYAELAARLGFSPNLGAVQLTDDTFVVGEWNRAQVGRKNPSLARSSAYLRTARPAASSLWCSRRAA